MKRVLLYPMMLALACGLAVGQSQYKVLYNFVGSSHSDGQSPNAGLVFRNGTLFGTTFQGGAYTYGTVFAVGSFFGNVVEAVLYNFCTTGDLNTCPDGAFPTAGLISDEAGNLYGTTRYGGNSCPIGQFLTCGTVFKLTLSGKTWTETVVHAFGGTEGAEPTGQLIFDSAGNLYGTTAIGGAYDAGTVFELTPGVGDTWGVTTLHDFNPGAGDGAGPFLSGLAFDSIGNLYGTTTFGGADTCAGDLYAGCGTVFELSPNLDGTWTESLIYLFDPKHPYPEASVTLDIAGNIYGTTEGTSSDHRHDGSVFRLIFSEGTWKERAFLFDSQGGEPQAQVLRRGDAVFGTTYNGGHGAGTLFKIQRGGAETVLHTFAGSPNDGSNPSFGGSLLELKGSLYGATQNGGTHDGGTIFQFTP